MENILRKKGLSQTPFRLEIMKVFNNNKNAIPMSIIENGLSTYDRTTLYRNMKKFLEYGIIHEIQLPGQEKNYALCKDECSNNEHTHQHIHFRCNKCSLTSCKSVNNYPKVEIPGHFIQSVEIQAEGICETCMSNNKY